MALNPKKVSFLIQQIAQAEFHTYFGVIGQLFNYLEEEIKDNQLYSHYKNERAKWKDWSGNNRAWTLPNNLDDAKSLSFDVYNSIAENSDEWLKSFGLNLFGEKRYTDNYSRINDSFLGYLQLVLEEIINANPELSDESPLKINQTTAFIIHGHDNSLKHEVQLLLKRAGVHCIILHEQADRGRTIIDKLIEETKIAGYAVALLTPDDFTTDGSSRARQNVILEIGFFMGVLGKERLRMIVKEDIEIPSDLQGILYERYDSQGAWKIKLLKEIQAIGIHVDMQASIDVF